MVKKFGIACRSENDEIAGLFVNTDPSGYCRESKFQAEKTKRAIADKTITDQHIEHIQKKYKNLNKDNLATYIGSLKGMEASEFTRNNDLQKLSPKGWIDKGINISVMEEVQRDFIRNGGQRGKDYLITLIALHQENLGIIESSRVDDKWGIKASDPKDAGQGLNNLGKIHMQLQDEFGDLNIETLRNRFPGLEITEKEIEEKRNLIKKFLDQNKLNVMSITEQSQNHIVKPDSAGYLNMKNSHKAPTLPVHETPTYETPSPSSPVYYTPVNKIPNSNSNSKLFSLTNFLFTSAIVGSCVAIALSMPVFAPFIAEIGKYSLISNSTSFISPLVSGLMNFANISRNVATSLTCGALAGTAEQAIESSINLVNKWTNKIQTGIDSSKIR